MKDRRSKTSRENLGEHIPEALSRRGSVTIAVRVPVELAEALDKARGEASRSEYLREALGAALRTPEWMERKRNEFLRTYQALGAGPEDTEVESPLMHARDVSELPGSRGACCACGEDTTEKCGNCGDWCCAEDQIDGLCEWCFEENDEALD